jgi:hypothetical protein
MQTTENKSIVPIVRQCQYEPHTLYSLWDMISFLADGLFDRLKWLKSAQDLAEKEAARSGSGSPLSESVASLVWRQLGLLKPLTESLGLVASESHATALAIRVVPGHDIVECSSAITLIEELIKALQSEVGRLQFSYIPASKVAFFEQHDLFGERVSAAFPSAQAEIKDAGNCLAAALHTAAVFHLMRAVEFGLRALARHLKVRMRQPLDYACWEHVIRAIDKKLTALRATSKSKKKSAELEFYGRLLAECSYFKDAWRNPVSHARGRFSEAAALDVYGHVRDFMQRLSERVKEGN